MLIRQGQIKVLEAEAQKAFRTRIASFIREHHWRYVDDLTEDEIYSFAGDAIAPSRLGQMVGKVTSQKQRAGVAPNTIAASSICQS